MYPSLKALLTGIVDYAGLFPPTAMTMEAAVEHYTDYQSGPFSWMLGSFLVPLSRWSEFETIFQHQKQNRDLQHTSISSSWPIHLIIANNDALETVQSILKTEIKQQNHEYEIKAIEFSSLFADKLSQAIASIPKKCDIYFEVPLNSDVQSALTPVKAAGQFAKIRTGGLTPDAFPSFLDIAKFLVLAAQQKLPFKATAGLHHLLPDWHPLPAPNHRAQAKMQGFLNVAIAAAIAYRFPVTPTQLANLLEHNSLKTCRFETEGIHVQAMWEATTDVYRLSWSELVESRRAFFQGFGSCSFELPTTELQEAHLC